MRRPAVAQPRSGRRPGRHAERVRVVQASRGAGRRSRSARPASGDAASSAARFRDCAAPVDALQLRVEEALADRPVDLREHRRPRGRGGCAAATPAEQQPEDRPGTLRGLRPSDAHSGRPRRSRAASRCVYFCVVESEAWPSSSWIARRSAPACSRCVAKVCRSACGEISSGRPAARSRRLSSRAIERGVSRPPRALTKSGSPLSRPRVAARAWRSASREGRYARSAVVRRLAEGHDALPAALAGARATKHARRSRRPPDRAPPPPRRAGPSRRAARRAPARARARTSRPRRPRAGFSVSGKRHRARQRLRHARRRQAAGRVLLEVTLAAGPAEEGAQRREMPRERPVREPVAVEVRQVRAHRERVDLRERRLRRPPGWRTPSPRSRRSGPGPCR